MLSSLLWFILVGRWTASTSRINASRCARPRLRWRLALAAYSVWGSASTAWLVVLWLAFAALALLNLDAFRLRYLTRPFLRTYRRMLPSMSDTEREALEAGTVWWDGEIFTGRPNWTRLLSAKAPQLTAEEQAFIDGPCEELCRMVDDWDITHRRADLPPAGLGVPEEAGLLRDDHPEEVRRPRVLGVCAFLRAGEAREPQCDGLIDRRRAQLAWSRRTAAALRYRRTEKSLPAPSRARRGHSVLCTYRAARRFGRGIDSRHGRRLQRHVPGPRSRSVCA